MNKTKKIGDEMVFELDKDSKKIIATIQRNDIAEKSRESLTLSILSLLGGHGPVSAFRIFFHEGKPGP